MRKRQGGGRKDRGERWGKKRREEMGGEAGREKEVNRKGRREGRVDGQMEVGSRCAKG